MLDGAQIRVGDEDYTIELPKRPGKLTHKGKTRFFHNIVGLQLVSTQQRYVGTYTDSLILGHGSGGTNELIIPWDKISRIEITETTSPGNYFKSCKVTPNEGILETFDKVHEIYVEFEWTDSIARQRCSLIQMIGAVIEFGPLPTKAEQE